MHHLLKYFVDNFDFIWDIDEYQIVDAESTYHNGGDSYILLASKSLRLMFIQDRRQIFLDIGQAGQGIENLVSIDRLYILKTGINLHSGLMRSEYVEFLRDQHDWLVNAFSSEQFEETQRQLRELYRKLKRDGYVQ